MGNEAVSARPASCTDDESTLLETFLSQGVVRVPAAFELAAGSRLSRLFRWTLQTSGIDPDDESSVPAGLTSFAPTRVADMAELTPRLWSVVSLLAGGPERIRRPARIGNALISNHRSRAMRESWHVDGDFFVHFPDSPEQAFLIFLLWSDVEDGAGATAAVPAATGATLRHLAAFPGGRTSAQIPTRRFVADELARGDRPIALTGRAGDAWILHPLTAHQSTANPSGAPRFISNPVVALQQPLDLTRPTSPLERLTHQLLGTDWAPGPQARRATFTPGRIDRWDQQGTYTDETEEQPA